MSNDIELDSMRFGDKKSGKSKIKNCRNLTLSFINLATLGIFTSIFYRQMILYYSNDILMFFQLIIVFGLAISNSIVYMALTCLISADIHWSNPFKSCRAKSSKYFIVSTFALMTALNIIQCVLYLFVISCVNIDSDGYVDVAKNLHCRDKFHALWGDFGAVVTIIIVVAQIIIFPFYVLYSIKIF